MNVRATASRPPVVTAILSLAFLLAIIDRMIFSLLITPIKADLAISDTQVGALAGLAFGLFYTLLGLPLGRLADRVHRPRLIAAGLMLWTLATMACGLARSFEQLFIARVCVGVGEAAISPAAYSLLTDYVPRPKLARALAIYMMGTVVGVAVAWLAGGRIIGWLQHGSLRLPSLKPWSAVFFIAGAPGLIVAPFVLAIPEVRPTMTRRGAVAVSRLHDVWRQLVQGRGAYAAHFVGVAALNTYAFALLTWAPAMFTREFGWPLERVGLLLGSTVGVAGIVGIYAIGAAADRLVRRGTDDAPFRLMAWIATAMLPFAAGILMTHGAMERLFLFLVPLMTLFFMLIACAPTALQIITPPPLRGSVSAVYLLVVNITAYSLGPTVVGALADRHKSAPDGLATAVQFLGMLCVPLAIVAFGLGLQPFSRQLHSQIRAR